METVAAVYAVDPIDVLRGFDVAWERRPHRVESFEITAAGAQGAMHGGSWADGDRATDLARVHVNTATLCCRPYLTASTSVQLAGRSGIALRNRVAAQVEGSVPIELIGTEADAAVWLTGFSVQPDAAHPDGYTLESFAIHLEPPRVDAAGQWSIPYRVAYAAGPVPDRAQSLRSFGADLTFAFVVVPAAVGDIARSRVQAPIDLGPGIGKRKDSSVVLQAPWTGCWSHGVVALSGFSLDLANGPFDGRYTRRMSFELGDSNVRLGFDNAGPIARPVHAELAVEATSLAPGCNLNLRK